MRLFLVITVLALVALGVAMETCPAAEDLRPCNCIRSDGDLQITCPDESLSDAQTLKRALRSLSGKQRVRLEFTYFALGRVPLDILDGIGVIKLNIAYCTLDTLSDGGPALVGLENVLEELSISQSFTEYNIPAKLQIGHLKRLKRLTLSENNITELGNDWFQGGPTSLEDLNLSNNRIEKIGSHAFADLVNLTSLWLTGNRFGTIQRSMLPSAASQLRLMDLMNNALTWLPHDIFTAMPSLTWIFMNKNGIQSLDERVWSPVWQQLQYLYLEDNPIHCDDRMSWLFKRKLPLQCLIRCQSPKQLRGKFLEDFIKSRRL